MQPIIFYYILINAAAFIIYGADKFFAKKGMRRIPEKTLIPAAAIGGAFGAYAGMQIFRHKTKHAKFNISIPVLMAVHLGMLAYLFKEP